MQRGILGGTFDPPHYGHLLAGETAFRDLGLDVVTYVPAGDPWQKEDQLVADAAHRVAMISHAIDGVPYFEVDDRETLREGPSFTIDTLTELDATDDVTLVVGADAAGDLNTWHRWQEVVTMARIAVAPRPGVARSDVDGLLPEALWLDMPRIPFSGTQIRDRVKSGKSVRFMTPDSVLEYLEEHDLYG